MIIKKFFKTLTFLIILFAAIMLVINFVVISNSRNRVCGDMENSDQEKSYDCILVLGASVNSDGQPSMMLKDRLDRGIELYKAGFAPKLLMSGDNGQIEYNEVEAMKTYALKEGVPAKDIFLDHAGFSSYESMYRARDVFAVRTMLVVTQKYHAYRSVYIANKLGIDAEGVSCNETRYAGQLYRDLREILARDKDFFMCIIKPKPTYLGDVIDIHGDGRNSH
ncbi:MAG: DUF218 domain-containing protein [Clostridiales bacterium]|nr:DUF218 domain-containing protein [Clostridiales bacterium]